MHRLLTNQIAKCTSASGIIDGKLLIDLIDATKSYGDRLIFRDFNLRIDREPDATQFATLLSRNGLTDVCTALECSEPTRIDKFLYRSNSAVTISPVTWTNADPDFTDAAGQPLSDHDPVVVDFEWSTALPS